MIQFYHVSKNYDNGPNILTDLCLKVETGAFVFLTGPSGAGKTSLLKLLYREELPTEGQIIINGRNITRIPPQKVPAFRREIGIVFQDFKLLKNKTIFENVTFVLNVLGISKRERRQRAGDMLRRVGIEEKMHQYPQSLSGGEQQRAAIARALINYPSLLIADEPTGNLDPDLALEVLNFFIKVNEKGTTVVVATHDRSLIRAFNYRVLTLVKGRLMDSDPPVDKDYGNRVKSYLKK